MKNEINREHLQALLIKALEDGASKKEVPFVMFRRLLEAYPSVDKATLAEAIVIEIARCGLIPLGL